MDAAPFRQFLSSKVYASKEDLSEAVGVDKGADAFCTWVLDLRLEWRSRRSVGEYIQQRDRRTVNCLPDQWFRVAEQEIFNIWSVLHKRCRPRAKRAVGVQPKSRVQRRCLAHMGQCSYNVPSFSVQGATACTSLWQTLEGKPAVLWFDNFYRRNFRPVPGNENRSLNCTAGAIILLKRLVDIMPSFPSLSVLRQRIGYTADLLVQSHKNFIDGLQGLMDDPIRLQHVRCPLDIRRDNVTSPAWTPFFLTDLTVSATPDLVSIIHGLQEVQQHTQHRLPLLVDENIHYRVLKLVYSISYARYNVPLFITRTPVVYGTWHPYKYCVTLCYRRFFPLFTYFSYGSLNLGTAVPNFPKLIYMERMILVLLHLAHKWRQPLEQKLQTLRGLHRPGNANHSTLLTQVQGLVTLLYGYIPALFIIGSQVRDCHWSAQGEQHAAGPLLSRCLHVLLRLTLGYEDKVEYVRTIVVARLLWSQWFARLPGVAHSEEPCEALLSRVVHLMAQHPGNCTLQQVHDPFILTPVADQTPKDLQYVNVPKGLPQLVDRRFTRLMARFDVGVIPPLVWSSQKSSIVQDRWDPAKMDFPCALDTVLTAEHYRDLCAKTLQTLVKPVKVDADVMTELGRHVPQRPPGDMDTTVAQAQIMLRACNTPDRYKRRRPARAFAQRDPARIPAPPNADGDNDSDEDPPPLLVGQPEIQT